jgi:D-arabinose 1-dehydrogenase-like Zn-dependent alcohol dehydrogenase
MLFDYIETSTTQSAFIGARLRLTWSSSPPTAIDSQETLSFRVFAGVRAMNEVLPLERVAEAYERMPSGKARFRVVLTTWELA